jgi:hypothetical protein
LTPLTLIVVSVTASKCGIDNEGFIPTPPPNCACCWPCCWFGRLLPFARAAIAGRPVTGVAIAILPTPNAATATATDEDEVDGIAVIAAAAEGGNGDNDNNDCGGGGGGGDDDGGDEVVLSDAIRRRSVDRSSVNARHFSSNCCCHKKTIPFTNHQSSIHIISSYLIKRDNDNDAVMSDELRDIRGIPFCAADITLLHLFHQIHYIPYHVPTSFMM